MRFLKLKIFKYIVPIVALSIFIFFACITLRINIHGDAKFHTLFAKESAETGDLVRHNPYWIYEFQNNERIYVPIPYPLTSESLFSIIYLIGDETALKLYSPIMATIIFLLIYLCLKELSKFQSILISLLATLAISERLIMTPLIEPFLALVLLAGLFSIKKYFVSDRENYLYMSGLFFGVGAAIKQQGLFAVITIIGYFCCLFLFQYIKKTGILFNNKKVFLIFILITMTVPSVALFDQIHRNGTIAFAPGSTKLPSWLPFNSFLQPLTDSKFPSKPEALKIRYEIIGYNKEKRGLSATTKSFVLSPFLFYRSVLTSWITLPYKNLFNLILILFIFQIIKKNLFFKRNILFWLLVFLLILEEITASYILTTPVYQYHSFGIILITIIVSLSVIRFREDSRFLNSISVVLLILIFVFGYNKFILSTISDNGREDDYHIEGYKKVGEFVNNNIPKDKIFLSAETSFRYYAQRDTVWMNESIGDIVYEILIADNPQLLKGKLAILNVDFVIIDKSQNKRRGLIDYLPADGLFSKIKNNEDFIKIYDPYNDGEIEVYKVNYNR